MVKKVKSCVFISGNGSNLRAILRKSKQYNFPIKIELVISNNINAKGIKIAKNHSIPYKYLSSKKMKDFEKKSLFEIQKKKIKFLCLAGFMKVLSKNFIKNFKHKIINIHPSLLPKYKGLDVHRRILENKEKFSGCTVHFVNAKLDSGKIISQKKIVIKKNETEESLKKKNLLLQHKLYPESIISIFR